MRFYNMSKLMTVKETAAFLKVSRATIYNLINNKGLPFVKVGRGTRFEEAALTEWLKQQSK
jgi:excisionase family DNA binding protein